MISIDVAIYKMKYLYKKRFIKIADWFYEIDILIGKQPTAYFVKVFFVNLVWNKNYDRVLNVSWKFCSQGISWFTN